MFPPLALVRRMGDCTRPSLQALAVDSGKRSAEGTEQIHVGIRMPEFDVRYPGNLSRNAQQVVLRRLGAELEKQFEWKIARTTFDGNTQAFCYPYLGTAEGSVVFCRLEVKDYIAAHPARKAGLEASGFPQA